MILINDIFVHLADIFLLSLKIYITNLAPLFLKIDRNIFQMNTVSYYKLVKTHTFF
jgi:hypothetical protein